MTERQRRFTRDAGPPRAAAAGTDTTFRSGSESCAAWHFAAAEGGAFESDAGRPCVVLGHGFGGTRDSGLRGYAERFAAAGLDALVFDYRHFGDSEGSPRQLLSIKRQQQDYHAAIGHVRALDGVDPDRIVVWGSSYAGGHVVAVAVADGRVAAVVAQAPAMDGMATLRTLVGYAGVGQLARLTVAGMRDAVRGGLGRPPLTIPLVGPPGSLGAMTSADAQAGYMAIAGPTWRNEVCARIMLSAGSYRPGRQADRLPCPILIQIADRDTVAPTEAAEAAAWRAPGRAEVRRYPIGHFEIYLGEPFERSVADQLHFLGRHLAVGRPAAAEAVG